MNRVIQFILLLYILSFIEKWCDRATDGFTIASLNSAHLLNYPTMGSEEVARTILSQPFYYLGSGGQSFVFASADGKYVLKFFNNHPKPWIPLEKYQLKKMQKLKRAFTAYELVCQEIPDECGLIFLHLNKIDFHAPRLTLVDKLHITHRLNPNEYEFVLQKRAEPIQKAIGQYGKEALDAMKQLMLLLSQKNLHDEDSRIYRNIGFIGKKAILIDPGRCVIAHGRNPKFPAKFREWIVEEFPELSEEIQ